MQALCVPLYATRPFPWNWVIYLPLLVGFSLAASLACALLLKWMLAAQQPFWALFRSIWQIIVVFCTGAGIIGYAVEQVQRKLRDKNLQLEQAVAKGNAIIEQQEQELTRAHEIQRNLLPKVLPALPAVEIVSAWRPARG